MSYRIEYDFSNKQFRKQQLRWGRILPVAACLCILLVAFSVKFWPEGREVLESVLIPGDEAVTKEAFHIMLLDLRNGTALGEALNVFCREIIENAQTQTFFR